MFLLIFGIQFIWWLFLSLTRIGKIITTVWTGIATISWLLIVYFNYFPLTMNLNSGIFAIGATILSSMNLFLQLVIPPWAGLIAGTMLSSNSLKPSLNII
ncbi:MAG: hypothetical protein OD815_001881 [Candidatus Alkanophagales archaeon MCA70_species_2]|nr:hypothetical protein [Candidatus Alkanophaga liquidiphilum]